MISREAASWLSERDAESVAAHRWYVEIAMDVVDASAPVEFDELTASRFHLDIYEEEWGLFFCAAGRASWIRVGDSAFVHGRDDFQLRDALPPLREIGSLIRQLEQLHGVQFRRDHATIATNVPVIEPAVRAWLATL